MALETVLNRTARALGNLAMDAEGSALIHSAGNPGILTTSTSLWKFKYRNKKPCFQLHWKTGGVEIHTSSCSLL